MKSDLPSLDSLRDIVEPAPVSWWPPAMGWWLLFAGGLVVCVWFAFCQIRAWRRDAYRRAALGELQTAQSVVQVAEILKRAALVAYSRDEVASLSGRRWTEWLEATADVKFEGAVIEALTVSAFRELPAEGLPAVKAAAKLWICQHGRSTDKGANSDSPALHQQGGSR